MHCETLSGSSCSIRKDGVRTLSLATWLQAFTQRKGLGIAHEKETATLPLRALRAPERLYFPTLQHQGEPAVPVVTRGDRVKVGTLLAEEAGIVSANVHSSVSGTVRGIEQVLHPWGTWMPTIVVENDGEDSLAELPPGHRDPESLEPDVIRQRVRWAGIVGMGGAMFPSVVKLTPPGPVRTLIINGCECEPVLTCDHRTLLERTEALLYGIRALRRALEPERVVVAIEANKPDAVRLYQELGKVYASFEVAQMPSRYPYGAERVLIPAVTGEEVPPGKYPDAIGVVVLNVATVAAISDALRDGLPLVRRPLTAAGGAALRPANLVVPIGTPVEYVLSEVGLLEAPRELVLGGPMMGIAIPSGEVPVIKGTSGILARAEAEIHHFRESACLHCGRCVDVCPAGLMPTQLARLSGRGRFEEAGDLGATECLECGLCSYQCPADLPLTQLIRMGKREVLRAGRRKAAAAAADVRKGSA